MHRYLFYYYFDVTIHFAENICQITSVTVKCVGYDCLYQYEADICPTILSKPETLQQSEVIVVSFEIYIYIIAFLDTPDVVDMR